MIHPGVKCVQFCKQLVSGPIVWQCFLFYCFVSAVILFTPLRKSIVWLGPWILSANFAALVFVYPGILQHGMARRKSILKAQFIMILAAAFGLFCRSAQAYDRQTPKPLFEIVIPCCWVALLASPSIRKWGRDVVAILDFRMTIADLLYLTAVTCLAIVFWRSLR